ncbi:MAG: hypothetical protein A2068_09200 [Ignavibacteria bacterium GWB2_35_6b]|nr:MAG: hypothetical protein A2068_09200 [Ignavibacteria bacterium GWB2_35_6b]
MIHLFITENLFDEMISPYYVINIKMWEFTMGEYTLLIIVFVFLTIVNTICTIILYPGLKELVKELKQNF